MPCERGKTRQKKRGKGAVGWISTSNSFFCITPVSENREKNAKYWGASRKKGGKKEKKRGIVPTTPRISTIRRRKRGGPVLQAGEEKKKKRGRASRLPSSQDGKKEASSTSLSE